MLNELTKVTLTLVDNKITERNVCVCRQSLQIELHFLKAHDAIHKGDRKAHEYKDARAYEHCRRAHTTHTHYNLIHSVTSTDQ